MGVSVFRGKAIGYIFKDRIIFNIYSGYALFSNKK